MNTPILDFVRAYADSGTARLHMPGHKGIARLGCEPFDITEISGADDLFAPDGVIAESERNAAALFGAGHTLYSAEGATLAIKAMLALAAQKHRKSGIRTRVLAARNAHKSFLYGCALLDLDVDWLYGAGGHLCECRVSTDDVREALSGQSADYCAVYLTSPDYLGNVADVAGIAAVCKQYGIPLLVDNAHGAYLAFAASACHPIACGATMCADSAHKTLPALTGTAYLHVARDADPYFAEHARAAMALFASSSPSYLLLQSLDLCNRLLAEGYREALTDCIERVAGVRAALEQAGYVLLGNEPLKLTVSGNARGYTGDALSDALHAGGVEPEYVDADCVVLMCTPANSPEDLTRITHTLLSLPKREKLPISHTVPARIAEQALSIREAILSPAERVSVDDALGRICAAPAVSCPPAIPILISGERIDGAALALFGPYGIHTVNVVK